jgi:NitT/TauT family transport system substrate-binding protein
MVLGAAGLLVAVPFGGATAQDLTPVSLQLQWEPQAQFAGYFAADRQGYYEEEGLDVEILRGGAEIQPHIVGSDANGPTFTIAWVPKTLEVRDPEKSELNSDLVNIAQIFQRSGTRSVSWKDSNITAPADFAGKKVGVWDFGNEYEVTAAALKEGLVENVDYTKVIQPFNMDLLLNREIDVAEAMIYNEYAQVLEATNPDTGELYLPEDLNVINYNDVGTAMLQDALWARAAWLAEPGNEEIATKFLRASIRGWIYCREHQDDCIQYTVDAGSTLPSGHQRWMMNEILPLVWPSSNGIGIMPEDTYAQTVQIAKDAGIIIGDPSPDAFRTDLIQAALDSLPDEDTKGLDFVRGEVEVTPGGV